MLGCSSENDLGKDVEFLKKNFQKNNGSSTQM